MPTGFCCWAALWREVFFIGTTPANTAGASIQPQTCELWNSHTIRLTSFPKAGELSLPDCRHALVDAVDHFASLLAGGVETEVLQDDEGVEGNK